MFGIYLTDDITWRAVTVDEYGDPGTPSDTATKGRVKWSARKVTTWRGDEVLSSGYVIMAQKPNPALDRITYSGTEHIILRVEEMKRFSVVEGYRVFLA